MRGKKIVDPVTQAVATDETAASRVGVDNRRSFSTTFGTISIARSICESELYRPNEKRRLRRAPSPLEFIARRTCDASCEPVLHADPAEQQM